MMLAVAKKESFVLAGDWCVWQWADDKADSRRDWSCGGVAQGLPKKLSQSVGEVPRRRSMGKSAWMSSPSKEMACEWALVVVRVVTVN